MKKRKKEETNSVRKNCFLNFLILEVDVTVMRLDHCSVQ